jgi:hypothetical protein
MSSVDGGQKPQAQTFETDPAMLFGPGARVDRIAFVAEHPPGQTVLPLALPSPKFAILVTDPSAPQPVTSGKLHILLIPQSPYADTDQSGATSTVASPSAETTVAAMRAWTNSASSTPTASDTPGQWMSFQGAQICWTPSRCAILAAPERLDALRNAMVEASFVEAELRNLERTVAAFWPQLEADTPHAFEFDERSSRRKTELKQRFQQVTDCRARLARLSTFVSSPHVHPPTLASQINERLRDRVRMTHRYDCLDDQLDVCERVYELCGQRASDYKLARTGHMLEWMIIILLLTQVLLWGFEVLTSLEQ